MASTNFMIVLLLTMAVIGASLQTDDNPAAPVKCKAQKRKIRAANPKENFISHWKDNAQEYITKKVRGEANLNVNKAKNIIMFLGDGMSLQTVAAARMYMGGEELSLSFEQFPHFGLSKTYATNYQVTDSANSATAFLCGVKANYETIGVNAQVHTSDCVFDKANETPSIAQWAQDSCKATGIVTTSRITHATPAGVYAHVPFRDWENDEKVTKAGCDPKITIDIARQLVENETSKQLKVVLGGGRRELRDQSMTDEEGYSNSRLDGRDLIAEWVAERSTRGNTSYVWNRQALMAVDFKKTDYLLGLFEGNHILYNLDIVNDQLAEFEPSLMDMTDAAIKMLQKEENGYFLFVESARIDTGHHQNWARKAIDETKEFSKVIEHARTITNMSDTLIVVTSDHSHVMSYNGYAPRGSDILGLSEQMGSDNIPLPILSYANGMGSENTYDTNGQRKIFSLPNPSDPEQRYMSGLPLGDETHGGDDVGVYASGPWSHMFVGNYEQNIIPVAMAFAAKIGPYAEKSDMMKCSGAGGLELSITAFVTLVIAYLVQRNMY